MTQPTTASTAIDSLTQISEAGFKGTAEIFIESDRVSFLGRRWWGFPALIDASPSGFVVTSTVGPYRCGRGSTLADALRNMQTPPGAPAPTFPL